MHSAQIYLIWTASNILEQDKTHVKQKYLTNQWSLKMTIYILLPDWACHKFEAVIIFFYFRKGKKTMHV